jgi:hypothetical protein
MEDFVEVRCVICDTLQKVSKTSFFLEDGIYYFCCPYCGEYTAVEKSLIYSDEKEK